MTNATTTATGNIKTMTRYSVNTGYDLDSLEAWASAGTQTFYKAGQKWASTLPVKGLYSDRAFRRDLWTEDQLPGYRTAEEAGAAAKALAMEKIKEAEAALDIARCEFHKLAKLNWTI